MKKWICADWHLCEDRFELLSRPFKTKIEHIKHLVSKHNELVGPDDEVIMVGDVCYQKAPEFLHYVDLFNGNKTLIRGNHDRVLTDEDFSSHFNTIVKEGEGIEMDIEGIPCYITHYPTMGRKDRFNLVGHIHAAWKYQLNSMNVGVDANHFAPIDLASIPFHYGAITKFYDEDVWAAYNELNAKWVGIRGKKGSYFKPNGN